MIKKIFKILCYIFLGLLTFSLFFLVYFNLPVKDVKKKAELGITFSSRYATDIGLDWKEAYLAVLDDLKIKKIRIPVYWDLVEPEKGKFKFDDVDWQIIEAQKRNVEIILSIGQKVPRWPECFIPYWAASNEEERKESLVEYVGEAVGYFKKYPGIKYWQVENEPFLDFGVCPEADYNLVDREIAKVRSVDSTRKIIVSDSGELSFWISAAKRSDVFGTTLYREVVNKKLGAWKYPIGPNFFKFKKFLIRIFADQEKVIVIELQGEPWLQGWTTGFPLEDQLESMNAEKLRDNIQFAKNSEFSQIYVWGAEWYYYLKTQKDYSALWETMKELIKENS